MMSLYYLFLKGIAIGFFGNCIGRLTKPTRPTLRGLWRRWRTPVSICEPASERRHPMQVMSTHIRLILIISFCCCCFFWLTVVNTVSARELWTLILDMRLQGNMTREQFIKSTKYLTIGYIFSLIFWLIFCVDLIFIINLIIDENFSSK